MAARNGLEAPVNDDVGVFSLRQMGVETVFGRMCGGQETVEKYSERRRGEAHDYHIVARRRREAHGAARWEGDRSHGFNT